MNFGRGINSSYHYCNSCRYGLNSNYNIYNLRFMLLLLLVEQWHDGKNDGVLSFISNG